MASFPIAAMMPRSSSDPATARVGGIVTARVTRDGLAQQMLADVAAGRAGTLARPKVVVATNGQVIALYHRNPEFRALVDQADIVDPDGMPLILVSRLLLREPLPERVATTDFIWNAAAVAAEAGVRFYFLGGEPGIAAATAALLQQEFPSLEIVGIHHGYFEHGDVDRICAEIRASRADVLWLGMGSPLQERFAIDHRDKLAGVAWIRTCGGLFDHIGGGMPRAPLWAQRIGLEWLHRLLLEPRRLGLRYILTNPAALYHLLTKTHG